MTNEINIVKVLPHRKPFLFVDNVWEVKYMQEAMGSRTIPSDEFWVEGHFPNNPVYPGVLLLEMMAQVGGFVFANEKGEMPDGNFAYLSKVDGLKLIKKVNIGDVVTVKAVLLESFSPYYKVKTVARVNDKKVAEAIITYTFLKEL